MREPFPDCNCGHGSYCERCSPGGSQDTWRKTNPSIHGISIVCSGRFNQNTRLICRYVDDFRRAIIASVGRGASAKEIADFAKTWSSTDGVINPETETAKREGGNG